MSISVNGQSCVPPGFRFHPTEEELLNYYLRKKVASQEIDLDVIRDVDLNKLEPWDIQALSFIQLLPLHRCTSTIAAGSSDRAQFVRIVARHKDKKYPTGTRTNRATAAGFWKATGRDKAIYNSVKRIGMRKTLVFYKGRAPHGQKSDWIMHEYRLDDPTSGETAAAATVTAASAAASDGGQEDGWVVCRVFKKKHHHKESSSSGGGGGGGKHHGGGHDGGKSVAAAAHHHGGGLQYSSSDEALDQILQYMGRSCKQEHEHLLSPPASSGGAGTGRSSAARYLRPIETVLHGGHGFMKLPPLESPSTLTTPATTTTAHVSDHAGAGDEDVPLHGGGTNGITDWAMMDRLVASHLNGHAPDAAAAGGSPADQLCFDGGADDVDGLAFYSAAAARLLAGGGGSSEDDLWSFTRSSAPTGAATSATERLSHVSL
ncbi:hypothetical protein HU200_052215 [Digitaria exilis]|uniref:NAC domain-containing protein n=1 Tax=Digitaria exilis TaxID=1010633 RepID=A0A835E619_9POAL|nr:hypothetical protein HU200_052215 [Digitaria exilis]